MSLEAAAIAANRFGYGARPGELRTIAADPQGWLMEQLRPEAALPAPLADLPPTGEDLVFFPLYLLRRGLARRLAGAGGSTPAPARRPGGAPAAPMEEALRELRAAIYARARTAAEARLQVTIDSATPFRERLVHFWSDHFTVSGTNIATVLLPPSFERDVTRAHVAGSFADMLLAATRHPGMQLYLDNYRSIGPDSRYAQHPEEYPGNLLRGADDALGLNENHAREILELHTVGVDGGYDQQDVIQLARALTGWGVTPLLGGRMERLRLARSILRADDPIAALDEAVADLRARYAAMPWEVLFRFDEYAHEPGAVTVLGRRYGPGGVEQAEQVLRDLAREPATARFIAFKLCRHFIADTPPAPAVARVARAFRDSEGDLVAVGSALVTSPEAWTAARRKFKRPDEYLISTLRALDGTPQRLAPFVGALIEMGQAPYRPPGPDGWPDEEAFWASPDGIWKRIEWADTLARRAASADLEVIALARAVLGDGLGPGSRLSIERAASPAQALALLLVSPEFMRR